MENNSIKEFSKWKTIALSKTDFSRKGSVDEDILELVKWINAKECYFTTSSCSGRIVVCSDDEYLNEDFKTMKKSCIWYHISHLSLQDKTVFDIIPSIKGPSKIKYEGFVLHVQCNSLQSAKNIHQAAVESGFRNSGITFGKNNKKIIAAVRGTACLEVPLTNQTGELLLQDRAISYSIEVANKKLTENLLKIQLFFTNLRDITEPRIVKRTDATSKKEVYRKKNKSAKNKTDKSNNAETEVYLGDIFSNGG